MQSNIQIKKRFLYVAIFYTFISIGFLLFNEIIKALLLNGEISNNSSSDYFTIYYSLGELSFYIIAGWFAILASLKFKKSQDNSLYIVSFDFL